MSDKKGYDVVIRHGLFHYYVPRTMVVEGQEKEVLVEEMAFHNEAINVPLDSDYERGMRLGAFWSVEDAQAHYDAIGIPAPLLSQSPINQPPSAQLGAGDDEEDGEVDLTELDEGELVDWLMGTGRFDGHPKPTVGRVVEVGEEGGPEFSERLLEAEKTSSSDAPRQGVVDGLSKVAA